MADEKSTVLGIRLGVEERKKFDDFVIEGGKNNKDFLTTLLNLYELNKGKEKNINLSGDIELLEGYTNKIQKTFVDIIDKLESQKGEITENSQKELEIYKEKVNNLENEFDALKTLNSSRQRELGIVNDNNKALKEQNSQLQQIQESNKALIQEYKEKNDTLNSLVVEYKAAKIENDDLKNRLNQSNINNIKINNEKTNKDKEIEQLNISLDNISKQSQELKMQNKSDKDELISQYKLDILSLKKQSKEETDKLYKQLQENKQQYKIDMETLKDQQKSDIEKSTQDIIKSKDAEKREVIITLKEEQQMKLQSAQDEYNRAIGDYQNKYKIVLTEFENTRNITKKS